MMTKKRGKGKIEKRKRLKLIFAEKLEMFAIVSFIFSLFLLDVNANLIGAYGPEISVNILFGSSVKAVQMFWVGLFLLAIFQFLLSTRTLYHSERKRKHWDFFFSLLGIIGFIIILLGGILLFWHNNALEIPIFNWKITRINLYHIGIGIETIFAFYFALFR
jgi:heme/copper-type cytochrome/quinol oxidase subunit 4